MDHNEMMAVLADAAVFDQPRLFAVHGLCTRPEGVLRTLRRIGDVELTWLTAGPGD